MCTATATHLAALATIAGLVAWITLDPPPTSFDGRTILAVLIAGAIITHHARTEPPNR